ncbi:hypothetical protein LTR86_001867 [Recurvomyces mirabilis]|nr:hypothetical protein LTR86_001867 [Recurvomyces mirabilis]
MLVLALRRAQWQLQAHRQWLRTFATIRSRIRPAIEGHPKICLLHHHDGHQHERHFSLTKTTLGKKTAGVRRSKAKKAAEEDTKESSELDLLNDLRQAVQDLDINAIIDLFPHAKVNKLVDRNLVWRLSQCLHESLRRVRSKNGDDQARRAATDDLVQFAKVLVRSIVKEELEPDRRAHVHLLAFFKESGALDQGITFWSWLQQRDSEYVDADVYGAAIELLAVNGAPLSELEGLYTKALEQLSSAGNFSSYHLSPDAMVPDREAPITIKGISMTLLQGILTARLLRGESRRAYLALDTALRLYPTLTPVRFFTLFIDERPLSEAYVVFALACRAGIVMPVMGFRRLLTTIRQAAGTASLTKHIASLRQMLSVLYMFVGAGGRLTSNLVSEYLIAVTQIMRVKDVDALDTEQREQLVNEVLRIIRRSIDVFSRYGGAPGISAINSLIVNLGGFGKSRKILTIALNDARQLGLEFNNITRRSILIAAGQIGDVELVKASWLDLVDAKVAKQEKPDDTDYHILIKAARGNAAFDFAIEECQKSEFNEDIKSRMYDHAYATLPKERERADDDTSSLTRGMEMMEELGELEADLEVMERRTVDSPATQDFSRQNLPLTILVGTQHFQTPESDLRALYDALTSERVPAHASLKTTDQSSQEATHDALSWSEGSSSALSTTGMTFGQLRYQNWKSLNELLVLSELNDTAYGRAVDVAIAKGEAPPPRERILRGVEHHLKGNAYGLSDLDEGSAATVMDMAGMTEGNVNVQIENSEDTADQAKEILRLRGRSV